MISLPTAPTNLETADPRQPDIHAKLQEVYREIGRHDCLPITIGPSTSFRYALFAGLKGAFPTPKVGLVYIGPHLDVRRSVKSGRPGDGVSRLLLDAENLLEGRNTLQIGWSLDELDRSTGERSAVSQAAALGITVVSRGEISAVKEIVELAISTAFSRTMGVYVSVDLSILEGNGTPMAVVELTAILLGLIRRMPLVGLDFLGGPFAAEQPLADSAKLRREILDMVTRTAQLIENFTRSGEESTLFD